MFSLILLATCFELASSQESSSLLQLKMQASHTFGQVDVKIAKKECKNSFFIIPEMSRKKSCKKAFRQCYRAKECQSKKKSLKKSCKKDCRKACRSKWVADTARCIPHAKFDATANAVCDWTDYDDIGRREWVEIKPAQPGGWECKHSPPLPDDGTDLSNACQKPGPFSDVPCPQVCVGEWLPWEECTVECGPDGTQTRRFQVTQLAKHGGEQCEDIGKVKVRHYCDPEPKPCTVDAECEFTEWNDAECKMKKRRRRQWRRWIQVQPAKHGGNRCEDSPPSLPPSEKHVTSDGNMQFKAC